jgi:hypothetical protein
MKDLRLSSWSTVASWLRSQRGAEPADGSGGCLRAKCLAGLAARRVRARWLESVVLVPVPQSAGHLRAATTGARKISERFGS